MLSFGLMTLSLNNEKGYFYELAKRAQFHNIRCFRFVPSSIHPFTQKVTGEQYNPTKDKWEPCEFPIPEIIYDRCFYMNDSHSSHCKAIVKWLKTRKDTLFLGHGLPNKLKLYEVLANTSLSPYLLHSKPLSSGEKLIQSLSPQQSVMIKPVNGSQGRGIYLLEKTSSELHVQTDKQDTHLSRTFANFQSAIAWLTSLTSRQDYFVQPYVNLRYEGNLPFDIRTLIQKDEKGNWREICRGIRTGMKDGIISNLSAGGSITSFESWIQKLPMPQREFIRKELDDVLTKIPIILEQKFPPLFELGVDIGISDNGAIWVLDINSKPGRTVALTLKPELTETLFNAPLLYGKTLKSANSETSISRSLTTR
ncbi:YheC/YheD family endospore coat-associated protein [Cytobacillus massiliigabonensis]|uniref:YheC/YheD family endospore coat-associated protein n=1 Tax=Cytobacillus massiliigabonensis TaxID=1871011 RepID=UPI000C82BD3A|nr:YheC/YheD family protein [Cytobacillus massiliigabonensis]